MARWRDGAVQEYEGGMAGWQDSGMVEWRTMMPEGATFRWFPIFFNSPNWPKINTKLMFYDFAITTLNLFLFLPSISTILPSPTLVHLLLFLPIYYFLQLTISSNLRPQFDISKKEFLKRHNSWILICNSVVVGHVWWSVFF